MIKEKIGLEVEYLLFNAKDEAIIPPSTWDRDDFPLLGEIRGKESEVWHETISNLHAERMKTLDKLKKGYTMRFLNVFRVPLKLYRKANKEAGPKIESDILNINNIDITDYSDQIVKGNKIQGINISCGLHIHFSCEEVKKTEYRTPVPIYEQVTLPLSFSIANPELDEPGDIAVQKAVREIMRPEIDLWRKIHVDEDDIPTRKLTCRASRLNKPAIHYIVSELDKAFFKKFSAEEKDRTKYRQPGFFEIKPYGFEYRSLPANSESMAALPEITKKAFELLKEINSL